MSFVSATASRRRGARQYRVPRLRRPWRAGICFAGRPKRKGYSPKSGGETWRTAQNFLARRFLFRKNTIYVMVVFRPLRRSTDGLARGCLRPISGPKIWRKTIFGLEALQPVEIPQNRQNIPWKSLALAPGKFGKAWHWLRINLEMFEPGAAIQAGL